MYEILPRIELKNGRWIVRIRPEVARGNVDVDKFVLAWEFCHKLNYMRG